MGANSWPQYNLSNFTKSSGNINKPVIAVSIKCVLSKTLLEIPCEYANEFSSYRVCIFGFLASSELGLPGNLGLKDQVCAFQWVRRYIAGFGGDPKNITAIGESAGSSTFLLHQLRMAQWLLIWRLCSLLEHTIARRMPRAFI